MSEKMKVAQIVVKAGGDFELVERDIPLYRALATCG